MYQPQKFGGYPSPGTVESFDATDPLLNDVLCPLLYRNQTVSGSERPVVAEGSKSTPPQRPPTATPGSHGRSLAWVEGKLTVKSGLTGRYHSHGEQQGRWPRLLAGGFINMDARRHGRTPTRTTVGFSRFQIVGTHAALCNSIARP